MDFKNAVSNSDRPLVFTRITNHFSNTWFGSNTVYYHATSASDLLTQNKAIHYWTENPSGGYILFTDYNNALSYFS